jgi:hypothetical protein
MVKRQSHVCFQGDCVEQVRQQSRDELAGY